MNDLMSKAKRHLSWCIWHEGVRPYSARFQDGRWVDFPDDINRIKKLMLRKQMHNSVAYGLIDRLNDDELIELIDVCCKEIPLERHLDRHFLWVCDTEGWRGRLRGYFVEGKYFEILQGYQYKQSHNPNAVNLLSCFRITEMIEYFRSMLMPD